jgi:pSer/pThr/pTyr-binding forkhead associated (FHA) protein
MGFDDGAARLIAAVQVSVLAVLVYVLWAAGRPRNARRLPSRRQDQRRRPIRLRIVERRELVRVVNLGEGALRIGRAPDNDIVIDRKRASRYHAWLRRKNDSVQIRDLGSRNGTFVNGRRIESAQLSVGDTVHLGGAVMTVVS